MFFSLKCISLLNHVGKGYSYQPLLIVMLASVIADLFPCVEIFFPPVSFHSSPCWAALSISYRTGWSQAPSAFVYLDISWFLPHFWRTVLLDTGFSVESSFSFNNLTQPSVFWPQWLLIRNLLIILLRILVCGDLLLSAPFKVLCVFFS